MNKGVCRICAWVPRVLSSTRSLQRPICLAVEMHKQQVGPATTARNADGCLALTGACVQAVVRCPQSEDQLMISLPLAGRVRNLDR